MDHIHFMVHDTKVNCVGQKTFYHSGLKGEHQKKNVSDNPSMDSFTKICIDSEKL